jgi:predicted P-loop ATPase
MRAPHEKDAALGAARQAHANNGNRSALVQALEELRDASEWAGVLAYNEFSLAVVLKKAPPWCRASDNCWTDRDWTDNDDVLAAEWLHQRQIKPSVSAIPRIIEAVAREASFHPVRDYLHDLEWDQRPRLATFAKVFLRAPEHSQYLASVIRAMFIGSIARVESPGCKVDHVPILEAKQGKLKSTAIEKLYSPWFTDDLAELGSKDAAMQLRGVWGIEISELSAMTRSEVEHAKAFITRRVDRYRPSYGRRVIEVPRQCVFTGTTNADGYLRDETGDRRFYPIPCGLIDVDGIQAERDQLWAEALWLYHEGEPWWLAPKMMEQARIEQSERYQGDPWDNPVSVYVEGKDGVSIAEVLSSAIGLAPDRHTKADANRVAQILRHFGWQRKTPRPQRISRFYAPSVEDGGRE